MNSQDLQERAEGYIALGATTKIFDTEAIFNAAPRDQIISVYLREYTEDYAKSWVSTAAYGWDRKYPSLDPEAAEYAQSLSAELPAKLKLMLILESPLVSNDDIAAIGW